MLRLTLFFLFLSYVSGGSPCLPRSEIYPCICIDRSIGKSKFHSTIICHGLDNGDSLLAIQPGLTAMEVDKFLLYDSFWPKSNSRRLQMDARFPVNHFSNFRMKEVEVVDTTLTIFGCPITDNCKTSYLKKFSALNSSISDKASCNNNGITIGSWISCPQNVEELTISNGFPADTTLKPEFFPEQMKNLKALDLTYDNIIKIDKRVFSSAKFPVLQSLNLSHNLLRDLKNVFSSPLELEVLDFSYNSIRVLLDFQYLPKLKTLKLNNNEIVTLMEYDWQHVSSSLRHIDLSNNSIQCSCVIKWINSKFHINAVLLGKCTAPAEVSSKTLRKASRYFLERCDENGNVGPKLKHKHNS